MRVTLLSPCQTIPNTTVHLRAPSALLSLIPASTFIPSHLSFNHPGVSHPFMSFPLLFRLIISLIKQCVQEELAAPKNYLTHWLKVLFLSPTPSLLSQILWKWGWESIPLTSFPGDSHVHLSLRLTANIHTQSYTPSPYPGKETWLSLPALQSPAIIWDCLITSFPFYGCSSRSLRR